MSAPVVAWHPLASNVYAVTVNGEQVGTMSKVPGGWAVTQWPHGRIENAVTLSPYPDLHQAAHGLAAYVAEVLP